MVYQGNVGWFFNKHYYRYNNLKSKISLNKKLEVKVKDIDNKYLYGYKKTEDHEADLGNYEFKLKTSYPGLLIGSGYNHGISSDEDFKIGFYFDYTTGLPTIPGSSIKGLLKNAFPEVDNSSVVNNGKFKYIKKLIEKNTNYNKNQLNDFDIINFKKRIFEDVGMEIAKRDVFYEAIITKGNRNNNIFADDYITPHKHPLKNPKPIKFLKILPEVVFQFRFDLYNDVHLNITGEEKKNIFRQIIIDLGAGAKTNVGYGKFNEL